MCRDIKGAHAEVNHEDDHIRPHSSSARRFWGSWKDACRRPHKVGMIYAVARVRYCGNASVKSLFKELPENLVQVLLERQAKFVESFNKRLKLDIIRFLISGIKFVIMTKNYVVNKGGAMAWAWRKRLSTQRRGSCSQTIESNRGKSVGFAKNGVCRVRVTRHIVYACGGDVSYVDVTLNVKWTRRRWCIALIIMCKAERVERQYSIYLNRRIQFDACIRETLFMLGSWENSSRLRLDFPAGYGR